MKLGEGTMGIFRKIKYFFFLIASIVREIISNGDSGGYRRSWENFSLRSQAKSGDGRVIIYKLRKSRNFLFIYYTNLLFILWSRGASRTGEAPRFVFFWEKNEAPNSGLRCAGRPANAEKLFSIIIFEYCIRKIFPEKYYNRETHRKISIFAEGRINIFDNMR